MPIQKFKKETYFQCEYCDYTSDHERDIKDHEKEHEKAQKLYVGQRVVWHTGSYGSEQGHMEPTWWPQEKIGVVVRVDVKAAEALVEFQKGERTLIPITELEVK